MKKILAIILSVVMILSIFTISYVSGTTYSYNVVQDFNGFAENEINRSGNVTVNEQDIKTILSGGKGNSFVSAKSAVSSSTGELITYGKDESMGLKLYAGSTSSTYFQTFVPVTAEMRQGAVGFRVWLKNRSLTVSSLQLRFYAQKDGTEYVYRKPGYSIEKGEEGYVELFFNDPEIAKYSYTPDGASIPDVSVVPELSEYNMSEDLTYIGVYVNSTSTGVISIDNFEVISSDAPVAETTVPTEEETTSTTVAPQEPSEEVEILTGGEWVQGFWTNGAISTATTNHQKRVAYSALLKVKPNTVYTFKTKTNKTYANSINVKEHNANKEQVANTNLQVSSLGDNFTKAFTTTADTHYLGVTFWSIYENNYSDTYAQIKALLDSGDVSVSIIGVVAVDEPEVAIAMVQGASVRFNEVTGMRYKATVDTAAVEGYIAQGYTVTMGTLIAPADKFASYEELTFDADANNFLDVVTTGYFDEDKGTIAGSISNIKEANYGRNFIARSYVKLTKDSETYVSYANNNDNTRSIKFLANAVIDNDALPVNTAQVELLNKWAAAADWKA